MEVSMSDLWMMLFLSFPCGALLAALYDVIRFFRMLFGVTVENPFKKGKRFKIAKYLFVALGDILFFAEAAALMCVFFFLTGDGRVRGIGLFGAAAGFYLYYHTLGRLFIFLSQTLISFIKGVLLLPFRALKKIFFKLWKMPIVSAAISRYNIYINKMKKTAKLKKQKRKRKKGQYCKN